MAFMAPAMSLVAERGRSVGVAKGAPRRCWSSVVPVELFLFMLFSLTFYFRDDASHAHGEDDAEPHLAAVHLFVGFRHTAERIFLDHRMHAGQRTEFQGVLRISRGAGIPTRHRPPSHD